MTTGGGMTLLDLTGLTDDELMDLHARVVRLITLRDARAAAETRMADLAATYQQAIGREDGDAWAQPAGAHDAYMAGATVTHDGKTWVSLIDWNAHAPGVSGWREVTEGDAPAAWVQPTGAHDAYQTGDVVSFEGRVYRSLIDSNVWSPASYPAGWEEIT